ncbi:cysteine--tRNA ligase, partial [Patescibacteria group bacterium]
RTFEYLGYKVDYIMNITDVGHLVSDSDDGEDKLEKGARREGKTAWEIAKYYTDDFFEGFSKLNLTRPRKFSVATDHIEEQINLTKKIEKNGFTYKISDGIYFDIQKYEKMGNKYGELSNLDEIKEGARVKPNPEKKDPRDFALWKFSPKGQKRQMEWNSPWGVGFPGWAIECSAMSMKYLGNKFDVHVGGEDLRSTHHPNEIAQSEGATGEKPFVKYWLHGAFLQIDGGRMGKSLGNAYTIQDVEKKSYDPLVLRYFYLTGHYRKKLNFTWKAFDSSAKALMKLRKQMSNLETSSKKGDSDDEKINFRKRFTQSLENDLNLPQALAVLWDVMTSDLSDAQKNDLVLDFDKVLGLDLGSQNTFNITKNQRWSRRERIYENKKSLIRQMGCEKKLKIWVTKSGTKKGK